MSHQGPTVGYRLEHDGRSLAYLPDHEPSLGIDLAGLDPSWVSGFTIAEAVDVLLHDSQYTEDEYPEHVGWGHSSIDHVVTFARKAGVAQLVLFHHDPSHGDDELERLLDRAVELWGDGGNAADARLRRYAGRRLTGRRLRRWSRSCSTPTRGVPSKASPSPTSPTTAPSSTARYASRSTVPRSATPSGPTPSTSCTERSTTPARPPTSVACCSPGTGRRRRTAGGRSAPVATNASGAATATGTRAARRPQTVDRGRTGRLHILEVQRLIRFMPKVVICVVPGWAAGGGHSLHVVCDLTIASREHARFKQTDADVASFDGGFGSAYLARQVGQKFAREIFFLGREYSADDAHRMGMVNAVVAHADLERTASSGDGS